MPFRVTLNVGNDEENQPGCYPVFALGSLVFVVVVKMFWPWAIPFDLFQFWRLDASLGQLLSVSWLLFAWGGGIALALSLVFGANPQEAEHQFLVGGFQSLVAGVFEEISFRWAIFLAQIPGYLLVNFLFFGFLGHGFTEWFYYSVEAPWINFLTLGKLQPILFGEFGWAVGAAMITANGHFRDIHWIPGLSGWWWLINPFRWLNTWFIGMFMFYLMFQYGLFAAMIVHFLYDLFIDIVYYLVAILNRALNQNRRPY